MRDFYWVIEHPNREGLYFAVSRVRRFSYWTNNLHEALQFHRLLDANAFKVNYLHSGVRIKSILGE